MLPEGYQIRKGSHQSDRQTLENFMYLAYRELFPEREDFSYLREIVAMYFSEATPFWIVESKENSKEAIATCWVGNAIDPVSGRRYAQILLVYVAPKHRRKRIATKLIQVAQNWAKYRGDRQIGLMVANDNQAALNLYDNLGFKTSFRLLTLDLEKESSKSG